MSDDDLEQMRLALARLMEVMRAPERGGPPFHAAPEEAVDVVKLFMTIPDRAARDAIREIVRQAANAPAVTRADTGDRD